MLGRNDKVIRLRNQHLHQVQAVSEVVLSRIQRLLFYYLIDILLIWLLGIGAGVAFDFLVELASGRVTLLLLYDEIGAFVIIDQGVLTYVC